MAEQMKMFGESEMTGVPFTEGKSYKWYEIQRKKKRTDILRKEDGLFHWETPAEKGMIRDICPECGDKVEFARNNQYAYWVPICKNCGFGTEELFESEKNKRTRTLRTKAIEKMLQRNRQKARGHEIRHWKYCPECGEKLTDGFGRKNLCWNPECEIGKVNIEGTK